MTVLPSDIEKKIDQLFQTAEERQEVKEILLELWELRLNVGTDQLARSLLVLSNGQLPEIKKIIASGFTGDPRDVVMSAENKMGNPGHFNMEPFADD